MNIDDIKKIRDMASRLDDLLYVSMQLERISQFDFKMECPEDEGPTRFIFTPTMKLTAIDISGPRNRPFRFTEGVGKHVGDALEEMLPSIMKRATELAEKGAKVTAGGLLKDSRQVLDELEASTDALFVGEDDQK